MRQSTRPHRGHRAAPHALAAALAAALSLGGCAHVEGTGAPPSSAAIAAFKEAPPGWQDAAPADAAPRGPWWQVFADPQLSRLAEQVATANLTVVAAAASVAQARALVREQRAALFPTLSGSAGVTRSRGTDARVSAGLQAAWEPDLWGKVGGAVTAAGARAQASEADLGSATLAAQAELASNYFKLREADAEAALLRSTLTAYERSLRIARNRYEAGIAPKSDVLQAQTQLATTQGDLAGLLLQRAQYEHAIAVLAGQAPAQLTLEVQATWSPPPPPAVPGLLPSTLLQRRPDIAGAERLVAAANAQIGVARAAWFPAFDLTAGAGTAAARVADLGRASAATWSLGLSVLQTIFDGGAINARIAEARAAWEQSVAQYRQAVLAAFQDVEDQLVSARYLAEQEGWRRQAAQAASQTLEQVQYRYAAGQVSYTDVVTAQVTALNAQRSLLQLTANRLDAAIGLLRALGGGWRAEAVDAAGAATEPPAAPAAAS